MQLRGHVHLEEKQARCRSNGPETETPSGRSGVFGRGLAFHREEGMLARSHAYRSDACIGAPAATVSAARGSSPVVWIQPPPERAIEIHEVREALQPAC